MTEQQLIPVKKIYVLPDFNPRRAFDEGGLKSLAASIDRTNGLIQPIVVRPAPCDEGEYHLVAGERRFRAVKMCGHESIEAVVRDCTLEQARKIALDENDQRENVTAGEEAMVAQKVVDAVDGDRDVAAKELGWSRSKLDSRLLLLHCVPEVIDALARGDILIGHAEHLAGVPEVTQRGTLPKLIDEKVSVADLKERLRSFSIPLKTACFDTAACEGCPHNSQTQANLFSDPLEGANCLNRECFNDKTQAALEEKKAELGEKYNIVVLATEKPDDKVRTLVKNGTGGVGPAQYRDCQQCAYFGARIENRLNGNTGRVTSSLCMNTACNDKMVAAHQAALASESEDRGATKTSGQSSKKEDRSKSSAGKGGAAELTKAAKVIISRQVREAAGKATLASSTLQKALVVEALVNRLGSAGSDLPSATLEWLSDEQQKRLKGVPMNRLDKLVEVDESDLDALTRALSAEIARADALASSFDSSGFHRGQLDRALKLISPIREGIRVRGVDDPLYQVDADLLGALPKAAIGGLLDEVGFAKWYIEEHDQKAYKALLKLKKKDLPDAIMNAGFDWSGVEPKLVSSFLAKP